MTADEKTKLNQLTADMKGLYAALRKADSLSEKELRRVTKQSWRSTMDFVTAFQQYPKVTPFRRDVPAETVKLYKALWKLNAKICFVRFR